MVGNTTPGILNQKRSKQFGFSQAKAISLGGVKVQGAREHSAAMDLLCSVNFVHARCPAFH